MSIITYPLDGKYYNAQDAETYLCTRTSGVFSEEISFTPNGMNITVSPFLAWIKNDDFSGKSVAVTTATTLTIPPSEPILSRIDMIVLRFDARKNSSELMVLKGTPSSSPSRPSIERTPVVYDLGLCQILVKPSATSISASNITSTLLDESLCGIMSDGVTRIPTSTLQSQVKDLIKELEVAISMAENGSPVLQSLGIKRGLVDVTIGTKGQKIYKSDVVKFDTIFLETPTVVVTRRSHYLEETVLEYIKPQAGVVYDINGFHLEVFSEKDIPTELTLRYNWIAIGKVSWDNNGGGGGDEEDDTKYFTISTSVEPSGSGTTEGAGNFAKGSTTKLVARASSGYTFEGWYLGNSKEASTAQYIVTVNSNATYTAKFVEEDPSIEDSIDVKINVEPAAAGNVTGAGTYPKGSTVNLKATPKNGYKFVGWYALDRLYSDSADYSVLLNGSITFTAVFEADTVTPGYYTITTKATPENGGTVTGGGTYEEDTVVTLKATPNSGYYFLYWTNGTETRQTETTEVYATSNQTWTAVFEADSEGGEPTYTSDTLVNGTLYVGTQNTNIETINYYEDRDDITKVVVPEGRTNIGYYVFASCRNLVAITIPSTVTFIGDGAFVSCENLTAITYNGTKAQWQELIESDVSYSSFEDLTKTTVTCSDGIAEHIKLTLSVQPSNSGNVRVPNISEAAFTEIDFNFIKDSLQTFTAKPKSGYRFKEWRYFEEGIEEVYITNPMPIYVSGNSTMTAVFEAETVTPGYCTITTEVTPENGGTVTGGGTYEEDTVVTLKATPNSGYYFLYWTNGTETRQTETTEVYATSNQTWTAVFEVDSGGEETTYTITTRVEPSGAGTVTGGGSGFAIGDYTSLEATANSGYRFLHWRNAKGDTYTDNPLRIGVAGDQTYTAVFESDTTTEKKTITFLGSLGTTKVVCNGVELSNSTNNFTHEFDIGDEVTLTFTPNSGKTFGSWVNDDTISTLSYDNPWTFTVDSSTATNIGIIFSET